MGQCYYKGKPIAGNQQSCNPAVHPGVSWVEGNSADQGFQGNFFVGKDFGNAVMLLL